ncbi:similar to Saccharomyces cerevisiae YMR276W DSK2 Nuclear-enriched ubiquitin-like polyubiquitin-binding protein [Maudiozyma saulgeensis]|uniref:Similar to Saccharomyces cerevisiae YMR276W DSK2 Nuclear-enriched ubiquitin-like polyubiquitin-binding protein n=1 Tax=Maudiozyma saulgeensis TaxID=1789683 RepID=A0A1X7R8W2_9SACH|nr:similar to Saccharomyces cerevisiae YMR276W DSK2 Nuclear-enriched ubiquitin-like polyubiquitin-binding protein [Kazachstania saulgeensis]
MSITIHVKCGQDNWEVTIEPSDTITQLKKTIKEISSIPEESQRLIYSGKILKDPETVESYKIQDGHAIHLVKSGLHKKNTNTTTAAAAAAASSNNNNNTTASVPSNIATGQTGGFNPLNDLTSARYAGYLNMPSADMFGPDGGMNNVPNQDEMMRMMENPIVQSQLNEMLSNPQMIDFMIQSNPQLQAMGPQARQMLQSPMFRQMLTNPEMMRQSMQFANMMNGGQGAGNTDTSSAFPAPGETGQDATTTADASESQDNTNIPATPAAGNPFSALFNPGMNPFASMGNAQQQQQTTPAFDPAMLASMFGGAGANSAATPAQPQDDRPPEERYETQLRQLNDMGFFDFDKNVAALRRSGGSVQGALDALLNGSV